MDLDLVERQAICGAELCRDLLNKRMKFSGHGGHVEVVLREERLSAPLAHANATQGN